MHDCAVQGRLKEKRHGDLRVPKKGQRKSQRYIESKGHFDIDKCIKGDRKKKKLDYHKFSLSKANNITMMPLTNSRFIIPHITSSITQTSLLTPFCAVSPHSLATAATKLQIQITLETIYEEEDDEKETRLETPASPSPTTILPNACKDLFKLPLRIMYVVVPRWISAVNQPYY
ncbi:hypothetical protein VNO80_19911 [Phaseolus coccineus]|uniref:Uncharacterized protein n=1 Tax=Phaseolus coccineus TaxID=3886 RepID=A0AAN9MHC0_PHACN